MMVKPSTYSILILIFLNQTSFPCSCKAILPCFEVPKPGIDLNLLFATNCFQPSFQRVVDTTSTPLSSSFSLPLLQTISAWFHSSAGLTGSDEEAMRSYRSPARCL